MTAAPALQALNAATDRLQFAITGVGPGAIARAVSEALALIDGVHAALSAAQDAPAEPCGRVTAEADRSGRRWHFTPNREAWEQLTRQPRTDFVHFDVYLAARASQPTTAQDAAATVLSSRLDIDFWPAWIKEHPALFAERVQEFLDTHPGEQWECRISRFAYRTRLTAIPKTATPPAPQAAPTAAQPVAEEPESRILYGDEPLGEQSYTPSPWKRPAAAPVRGTVEYAFQSQAPALVPLTDALAAVATSVRDYLQQTIDTQSTDLDDWRDDVSWAIKALTNGITPAGITPKEQQ